MSGAHCGQEWVFSPTYNSGYEDGRKEAKARIADLEAALRQTNEDKIALSGHIVRLSGDVAVLSERVEYALRNLNITEKARQEERAKRDELQRQVTELATTIEQLANIGGHHG